MRWLDLLFPLTFPLTFHLRIVYLLKDDNTEIVRSCILGRSTLQWGSSLFIRRSATF